MSHVIRKPAFCLCENKGADQLCGNCAADQRLCFGNTNSTISLLSKPLAIFCGCTVWFVLDMVGNPEERFSHDVVLSRDSYQPIHMPSLVRVFTDGRVLTMRFGRTGFYILGQNGKQPKLQIDIIQREHTVNQVSRSFPKRGHSAI